MSASTTQACDRGAHGHCSGGLRCCPTHAGACACPCHTASCDYCGGEPVDPAGNVCPVCEGSGRVTSDATTQAQAVTPAD